MRNNDISSPSCGDKGNATVGHATRPLNIGPCQRGGTVVNRPDNAFGVIVTVLRDLAESNMDPAAATAIDKSFQLQAKPERKS